MRLGLRLELGLGPRGRRGAESSLRDHRRAGGGGGGRVGGGGRGGVAIL